MRRSFKGYRAVLAALIIGLFVSFQPLSGHSQDQADTATSVSAKIVLNYLCTSNDSVKLTAGITFRREADIIALENAGISFTASDGTIIKDLGIAYSDQFGNAVLKAPLAGIPATREGMVTYTASFAGKGKYEPAEATFSAKPARIKLSFNAEDSLRIMKLVATSRNEKGEEVPAGKETVSIYVPRLFSLLKIGEVSLEEDGTGLFEFPGDIVGDTLGNLEILAKIEEHDLYGYVQGRGIINWGVHKQYYKAEVPSRELWTPIAPLWMIITLIIMLLGVWAHYVYAVYELVMIKKLSKKDKPLY
jgi:hypothetical protein